MSERYETTCIVECINNNASVQAEILNFQPNKLLTVSLNRSVKLTLQWNGRVYEGSQAGMTFTSNGPNSTIYYNQRIKRK